MVLEKCGFQKSCSRKKPVLEKRVPEKLAPE
jgi:hypothetical protein